MINFSIHFNYILSNWINTAEYCNSENDICNAFSSGCDKCHSIYDNEILATH